MLCGKGFPARLNTTAGKTVAGRVFFRWRAVPSHDARQLPKWRIFPVETLILPPPI